MLLSLKKKKAEYDELMEKLQREVSCHSQFSLPRLMYEEYVIPWQRSTKIIL